MEEALFRVIDEEIYRSGFKEMCRSFAADLDDKVAKLKREQRENRLLLDSILRLQTPSFFEDGGEGEGERLLSPKLEGKRHLATDNVIVIEDDDEGDEEGVSRMERGEFAFGMPQVHSFAFASSPAPPIYESLPHPSSEITPPPPIFDPLPAVPSNCEIVEEVEKEKEMLPTISRPPPPPPRQPPASPPHPPPRLASIPSEVGTRFIVKKTADTWWNEGSLIEITCNKNRQPAYRIQLDKGEKSLILPHFLAAVDHPTEDNLQVETRVVGLYAKFDKLYSGLIAELPGSSNNYRYLVFYDDGFAQYLQLHHLHKVYIQDNSYGQVRVHSRDFIRDYFQAYPRRPMVTLNIGDKVKTEYRGSWSLATVHMVDGSLVQMRFTFAKQRLEWIYRGNCRLEPMSHIMETIDMLRKEEGFLTYKEILQNFVTFPIQWEHFEITCFDDDDDDKKKRDEEQQQQLQLQSEDCLMADGVVQGTVDAMEQESEWQPPWIRIEKERKSQTSGSGRRGRGRSCRRGQRKGRKAMDVASVLLEKLKDCGSDSTSDGNEVATEEKDGQIVHVKRTWSYLSKEESVHYSDHDCSSCDLSSLPAGLHASVNYLSIPPKCGFSREIIRRLSPQKTDVYYRAPCNRRLRSMSEVAALLKASKCSGIFVDQFCFDPGVSLRTRSIEKTVAAIYIEDISQGIESVPISCVNDVDEELPPNFEYRPSRFLCQDAAVNLISDPDFLVCCDCTDDCEDKSKCACFQLSRESALAIGVKDKAQEIGFHHKRLAANHKSAIYECNSRCKCSAQCGNRVLQIGIRLRLQVFKTVNRGWGVRCLDDIPKGAFVCTYSGRLMTEEEANKEGYRYGDEYLAELDHIEVIDKLKEGYESDVSDISPSRLDLADHLQNPNCSEASSTRPGEWGGREGVFSTLSVTSQSSPPPPSHHSRKKPPVNKARRLLFGESESGRYAVDAKSAGNVGRFFNHGCMPNLCVQNVFVDTHDLRFPVVAFFTKRAVKANLELTWDYSYEIGSVPGKMIRCHCGSRGCRGRLL